MLKDYWSVQIETKSPPHAISWGFGLLSEVHVCTIAKFCGFHGLFSPIERLHIRIRPKQAVSDCMLIKYTNTPFLKKVSEPLSTVLLYKGSAHVFWCVHVYEIRSLGVLMIGLNAPSP